jgi:arylsulfatase A
MTNVLDIVVPNWGREQLSLYGDGGVTGLNGRPYPQIPFLFPHENNCVRFTKYYSAPVHSAAMGTSLTGRYPGRNGLGHDLDSPTQDPLLLSEITLPRVLKRTKQVRSGFFGFWGMGNDKNGGLASPRKCGFEHFAGIINPLPSHVNNVADPLLSNPMFAFNWSTNDEERETRLRYIYSFTTEEAARWIRTNKRKQWFAQVVYPSPCKTPHRPPVSHYDRDSWNLVRRYPLNERDPIEIWPYVKASYEALDFEIGRLVVAVQALAGSTTIIIRSSCGTTGAVLGAASPTTDEAEYHPLYGFYSNRRGSNTAFDDGVRVPMLISGAAVEDAPRVSTDLVQATDLFSTVLDIFGVSGDVVPDRTIDSVSFKWVLENAAPPSTRRLYAFTETFATNGHNTGTTLGRRCITDGRWKLTRKTN